MFTPVKPETAIEIENQFRDAKNIGEFVDATTRATNKMYTDSEESTGHPAVRRFNAALNAALVETLGGRDFPIRSVPDTVILIEQHAAFTGIISALLLRQQEELAAAAVGQEGN